MYQWLRIDDNLNWSSSVSQLSLIYCICIYYMILILLNIFIDNPILRLCCWLMLAGPNDDECCSYGYICYVVLLKVWNCNILKNVWCIGESVSFEKYWNAV